MSDKVYYVNSKKLESNKIYERINFRKANPKAGNMLAAASKDLSSIDHRLRTLVELRVSQINGYL